jgi:hypothetical protein
VSDPARMTRIARIDVAPGARTGLLVPEWNQLFVAVPKRGDQTADVRIYDLKDGK